MKVKYQFIWTLGCGCPININFSSCRQVDLSPNSWRETSSSSLTVETFLSTRTTKWSCLYEPAGNRTPDSWPCLSNVKVCSRQKVLIQKCTFERFININSNLETLFYIQVLAEWRPHCSYLPPSHSPSLHMTASRSPPASQSGSKRWRNRWDSWREAYSLARCAFILRYIESKWELKSVKSITLSQNTTKKQNQTCLSFY